MVTERLTEEELAARLEEVLDRVNCGGRFEIERDGEVFAEFAPPTAKPGITAKELIARVGNLEMPGEGFADALEEIQANQGIAEIIEWPD